jgi:transposase-like protein
MHQTHLPLQKWFWAIFLVFHDKRGVSAVRLQHELGISYPTAWLMLQKIRKGMGDRDAGYKLAGLVEMDETYFGGPKRGKKRGRGTEKAQVLAAVSIKEDGKPGYVKTAVTGDIKSGSLVHFAKGNITAGSTISSDAYRSYLKAFSAGEYQHEPGKYEVKEGNEHLKWLHIIISNAKRFILGTYHGLDGTHFQAYLDEYCYRVNRRSFAAQLFDRLLCACTATSTIT